MAQVNPINGRPVSIPTGEEIERQIKEHETSAERWRVLKQIAAARDEALAKAASCEQQFEQKYIELVVKSDSSINASGSGEGSPSGTAGVAPNGSTAGSNGSGPPTAAGSDSGSASAAGRKKRKRIKGAVTERVTVPKPTKKEQKDRISPVTYSTPVSRMTLFLTAIKETIDEAEREPKGRPEWLKRVFVETDGVKHKSYCFNLNKAAKAAHGSPLCLYWDVLKIYHFVQKFFVKIDYSSVDRMMPVMVHKEDGTVLRGQRRPDGSVVEDPKGGRIVALDTEGKQVRRKTTYTTVSVTLNPVIVKESISKIPTAVEQYDNELNEYTTEKYFAKYCEAVGLHQIESMDQVLAAFNLYRCEFTIRRSTSNATALTSGIGAL